MANVISKNYSKKNHPFFLNLSKMLHAGVLNICSYLFQQNFTNQKKIN